jgi:hypothetical protein
MKTSLSSVARKMIRNRDSSGVAFGDAAFIFAQAV